jgi:hypothetical protein
MTMSQDYSKMTRAELQQKAKEAGIKANGKTADLIQQLEGLLGQTANHDPLTLPPPTSTTNQTIVSSTNSDSEASSSFHVLQCRNANVSSGDGNLSELRNFPLHDRSANSTIHEHAEHSSVESANLQSQISIPIPSEFDTKSTNCILSYEKTSQPKFSSQEIDGVISESVIRDDMNEVDNDLDSDEASDSDDMNNSDSSSSTDSSVNSDANDSDNTELTIGQSKRKSYPKIKFRNYHPIDKTLKNMRSSAPSSVLDNMHWVDTEVRSLIEKCASSDPLMHIVPKKINWDLKRDCAERIEILRLQTRKALVNLSQSKYQ